MTTDPIEERLAALRAEARRRIDADPTRWVTDAEAAEARRTLNIPDDDTKEN